MSAFIESLESRSELDTRVRATLRRSLSFAPGAYVPAFRYIESFVKDTGNVWRREAHYLVAGVWAAHWREGSGGAAMSVGKACAEHQRSSGSSSTERRFINLLDADTDQVAHRLRQMIALLKDQPIDFDDLLKGLINWDHDEKRTQRAWARDFYRSLETDTEAQPATQEEEIA